MILTEIMNESDFKKILNRNIEVYLNNIAIELEEKHSKWFEDFGFPIFGSISKDYHEQVYFQSYLEAYTRIMINSILFDLVEEASATDFKWPEFEHAGVYRGYTNSEYERDFDFEFIDKDNLIGYRYTYSLKYDELVELLQKSGLKKIKVVDWECEENPGTTYDDERFEIIGVYELFRELLWEYNEEDVQKSYALFISDVKNAVNSAEKMISLHTIPGFTPGFLHEFKKRTIHNFEQLSENQLYFRIRNKKYKVNEENSKSLMLKHNLLQYIRNKKLQLVLVGDSDYAKCFLTSEYLYQYFNSNSMFDFTPIVSGYLKSIEQLLHSICVGYCKATEIDYKKQFYKAGLGDYISFLKQNECIFRKEIRDMRHIITDCLDSYRIVNRNRLFHKDYFNKWNRVDIIRENTVFLYIALIGTVDLELIDIDGSVLKMFDDSYERLFKKISRYKGSNLTLVYPNRRYKSMRTINEGREGLRYDEKGIVCNTIEFKQDDSYYDVDERLTISADNMPVEVWREDLWGKEIEKLW